MGETSKPESIDYSGREMAKESLIRYIDELTEGKHGAEIERLEKRIRYLMKEDERIGNQRTEDMEKAIRNEE